MTKRFVRRFGKAACLSLAVLILATRVVAAEKPNIVLVMTDDQEDGPSVAVMKNLKALVAVRGVVFQNSFVENPICCPSRATLVTGQYSHNNGVFSNNDATVNGIQYVGGYKGLLPTDTNTLPVWLKNAGYRTAMIGKYVNGYSVGGRGTPVYVPPGWDRWFARAETGGSSYFGYEIDDQGTLKSFGKAPHEYLTDVLLAEALSFIEAKAASSQPFFLAFMPSAPHGEVKRAADGRFYVAPPVPAPRHAGAFADAVMPRKPSFNPIDVSGKPAYMRELPLLQQHEIDEVELTYRRRLESMLAVDEAIAAILKKLELTGKSDDTLIIYTSDNGYFLGEHRRGEGKLLVYEESIRVPLMMAGPGVSRGEMRSQLVNNADLVATIVQVAGATPQRALDGRSLAPVLSDTRHPWRDTLLFQGLLRYWGKLYGAYRAVRTADAIYVENELVGGKLENEFYDLAKDPYQVRNVITEARYAAKIRDLQQRLARLRNCVGKSCWSPHP